MNHDFSLATLSMTKSRSNPVYPKEGQTNDSMFCFLSPSCPLSVGHVECSPWPLHHVPKALGFGREEKYLAVRKEHTWAHPIYATINVL